VAAVVRVNYPVTPAKVIVANHGGNIGGNGGLFEPLWVAGLDWNMQEPNLT